MWFLEITHSVLRTFSNPNGLEYKRRCRQRRRNSSNNRQRKMFRRKTITKANPRNICSLSVCVCVCVCKPHTDYSRYKPKTLDAFNAHHVCQNQIVQDTQFKRCDDFHSLLMTPFRFVYMEIKKKAEEKMQ